MDETAQGEGEKKKLRHKHFLQSHPYPAGCEGTETDRPAKFGGPGSVDLTACKWEVLTRNFSGSLYLPSSVESHKHRARFYTAPIRHHSVQCQIYSGKTTNYTNNVTRERHTSWAEEVWGFFLHVCAHLPHSECADDSGWVRAHKSCPGPRFEAFHTFPASGSHALAQSNTVAAPLSNMLSCLSLPPFFCQSKLPPLSFNGQSILCWRSSGWVFVAAPGSRVPVRRSWWSPCGMR